MTLQEYMTQNGVTLRDMEEVTEIDFRTLSLYKLKKVIPSIKNAAKIKKATRGKVKMEDWINEG